MKQLRTLPVHLLIPLCLGLSAAFQLAWLWQLFQAQQLGLRQELETAVGLVAERSVFASELAQDAPMTPYRALFLSPGWGRLRTAFDNLHVSQVGKSTRYEVTADSALVVLRLSMLARPNPLARRPNYNSHLTDLTPRQLAQVDDQSRRYIERAVDSVLATLPVVPAHGYQIRIGMHRWGEESPFVAGTATPPGPWGYISQPHAYNNLHLRTYQLVVPSLLGVVLYRLRFYLASAVLLLLLTAATLQALLQLLRNQRRYAKARLDFTRSMTHEFKTPVATVSLALEAIGKHQPADQPNWLREYLAISQQELGRLSRLLDSALATNQDEDSPAAPLRLELYDVQQGLEQALASLRPYLQQQGQLVFTPSPEPCFVLGDPIHLPNVFYNLLENALKHGGPGVQLMVECTCEPTQVRVSVQDNGPGIAEAYQQQVFERFFRVPGQASQPSVEGTGLGLHYVRQLVAQHGGHVALDSRPGTGSRFTIRIPRSA